MRTGTPIILAASSDDIPHSRQTTEDCQQVFRGGQPSHFHVVDRPISQLLSDADLLVYSHTTVYLEALVRGIPVLSVVPEVYIDLDTMCWFPALRLDAASHDELRSEEQPFFPWLLQIRRT